MSGYKTSQEPPKIKKQTTKTFDWMAEISIIICEWPTHQKHVF